MNLCNVLDKTLLMALRCGFSRHTPALSFDHHYESPAEMTNQRNLSDADIQKVVSTIDIPACPQIVAKTMAEAQKDEPDIELLSRLITNDAGMSAAALKLANSATFSRGNPLTSIRSAVDRLGMKNIVCVVVASALRNAFSGLPAEWLDTFWRDTMDGAAISAAVARMQYGVSPDTAFTYALFHDAAIPLMAKRFPDYLDLIRKSVENGQMLIEAETGRFPCTHPIVASLLIKSWGLPSILGLAIRFHHDPEAYDLPDTTLPGAALSFIAVTHIAEHLRYEIKGQVDFDVGTHLFERAVSHLGISSDDMDDLRTLVAGIVKNQA
jgi:HD-like signal output (HDOD) protein